MSVTEPTNPPNDLIGILDAIPPYLLAEANRIPDAPAGTPEASMTIAQRLDRLDPASKFDVPETTDSALMSINQTGLSLIESFEGLRLIAYWDSYGRCWTIGYGETSGVHSGEVWTARQAQADLLGRLARDFEPAVRAVGVPLNQNQFDALCDFVWNLGPGALGRGWSVGDALRAHDYEGAANALLEFDRSGGVVLEGLLRRREAERALFLTPPPPPPDPHHYARFPLLETFNNKHWDERAYVQRYDEYRSHWIKDRKQLKVSRANMRVLANHVWNAAHDVPHGHEPDWNSFYRGWRYQELTKRANGRVVKA